MLYFTPFSSVSIVDFEQLTVAGIDLNSFTRISLLFKKRGAYFKVRRVIPMKF